MGLGANIAGRFVNALDDSAVKAGEGMAQGVLGYAEANIPGTIDVIIDTARAKAPAVIDEIGDLILQKYNNTIGAAQAEGYRQLKNVGKFGTIAGGAGLGIGGGIGGVNYLVNRGRE